MLAMHRIRMAEGGSSNGVPHGTPLDESIFIFPTSMIETVHL